MFHEGPIEGVLVRPLHKHCDGRGWLIEIFRADELDERHLPVMSYVSETLPGVARGPHEHVDQADTFGFVGPSNFKVYMWDNRAGSPTFGNRTSIIAGEDSPTAVTVPAGVVHGYKNVGEVPGWVINCPNRLYAGSGKTEPVDEIRHESQPGSPFQLD